MFSFTAAWAPLRLLGGARRPPNDDDAITICKRRGEKVKKTREIRDKNHSKGTRRKEGYTQRVVCDIYPKRHDPRRGRSSRL